MTTIRARVRGDDSGLTLVELILALVLTAALMGVLASAFITGLKANQATAETLSDASDAQTLAAYLTQDAASVTSQSSVDTNGATASGCSDAASNDGTNLLRLQWPGDDPRVTTPVYTASYRWSQSTAASETRATYRRWRLVRYFCKIGSASSRTVVAQNLANPTSGSSISVDAHHVSINLFDLNTDGSTYSFQLSGTFRQGIGSGSSPSAFVGGDQAILIAATLNDGTARVPPNGKVDSVDLHFSKPVTANCSTGWSIGGLDSGYTAANAAAISADGMDGLIPIVEGPGYETAANSAAVSFTPASGCNLLALSAPVPLDDNAGPVVTSVSFVQAPGSGTAGLIEQNDKMQLAFSEPLQPSSIPSNVQIIESDGGGTADDTLRISSDPSSAADAGKDITAGTLDMGANDYVNTGGGPVVYAGHTSLSSDGMTLTVIVDGNTSGGPDENTAATAGTFSFTPSTTLTDPSGNAATTLTPPAPTSPTKVF